MKIILLITNGVVITLAILGIIGAISTGEVSVFSLVVWQIIAAMKTLEVIVMHYMQG